MRNNDPTGSGKIETESSNTVPTESIRNERSFSNGKSKSAHNSCVRRKPLVTTLNSGFARPAVTDAEIWIENGRLSETKSRQQIPAVESIITDFAFSSAEPCLSAIVVRDPESDIRIEGAKIELEGPGCSDFTSKGAGLLVYEQGKAELADSEIVTRGATRACTIATSGATLHVKNCKLVSYGGPLPADYKPVIGPGMMEPPYPLGLSGNCRTHLSMDNSETFFDHCDIYAAAWAAVSSDSGGGYCYAEVNDSNVVCEGNGYCGYADNDCHLAFNRCTLQSGNMAFIQDGNSSIIVKDTDCTCGRIGMMLHGGMKRFDDVGVVDIQNSSIQAEKQIVLCKSTNVDLYFRNTDLESKDGIIIESKITDDRMYFTRRTLGPEMYGIQVTFEDMQVNGDFLMGDSERKNCLHFVNAEVTGTISGNPMVWLEAGSRWTSSGSSLVTLMGPVDIASIDAGVTPGPLGRTAPNVIRAYAGAGCTLRGTYDLPSGGKLVILE